AQLRMLSESTFAQFLQFSNKLRARQVSFELPQFLAVAIENDQRGKSVYLILVCQLFVLLFQFGGLRLSPGTARPREVKFQQHQIFHGLGLENQAAKKRLYPIKSPSRTSPSQ